MRVFSVDPADPFLATLAARVVDGTLWPGEARPADPFALSAVTIYLPTRRAARALADAFIDAAGGATVLPRIAALGEAEDELPEGAVVGALEARVVLARLIRAWAGVLERTAPEPDARLLHPAAGPDAIRLAGDLLGLMDQVETQEADWSRLPGLVDRTELAAHWEITTDFLRIATETWPAWLAEAGKLSPAAARRAEAAAAAERLRDAAGPVIVAGSTGSLPATRRLIRAVAESPWGAVVLPGLDRSADAASWEAVRTAPDAPGHWQHGLHILLDALGLDPADVRRLAPPATAVAPAQLSLAFDDPPAARTALLGAALRPAPETHRWLADRAAIDLAAAFRDVAIVEAADEREEAAAIAIAMRESVERGETVSLVTPHRPLARRVRHALARFGLEADDSGGEPLGTTPAGVLARLVATVAAGGGAADWLALLKHPLATFGSALSPDAVRRAEKAFRGPRIEPGAIPAVLRGADATLAAVLEAMAPLASLRGSHTVGAFAAAHQAAVTAVSAGAGTAQGAEALAATFAELGARDELAVTAGDWPGTFDALVSTVPVRTAATDAPVRILGPLENRLQPVDHAILGGLNEGTWPQSPDAGPWMSRGMMGAFGIELPERRIGLSAHDFVMAAHAPRVTLTRARRAGGEPTVASRWWQRLHAFAGDAAAPARSAGRRLVALAAALDAREPVPPPPRPAPTPPLAARPASLNVTEVGRLVRDPYAVYARRVLRLKPLDPIEADPDASDRGSLVHLVLARFIGEGHHRRPDAAARLVAIAEAALAETLPHAPDFRALWGARLRAIAPKIAAAEAARPTAEHLVEVAAETDVLPGRTLRGRFDRIDIGEGGVEIIDYKTGNPPTAKQVETFLEPQLPLEAALLRVGALDGVPADLPIAALVYVAIASGRTAVDWRVVAGDSASELSEQTLARLRALLARYDDPATGYLSRARMQFTSDEGDYDHLARTAEWVNT